MVGDHMGILGAVVLRRSGLWSARSAGPRGLTLVVSERAGGEGRRRRMPFTHQNSEGRSVGRWIWAPERVPSCALTRGLDRAQHFWMSNTHRSQTFALRVGAHHFERPPALFPNLRPNSRSPPYLPNHPHRAADPNPYLFTSTPTSIVPNLRPISRRQSL